MIQNFVPDLTDLQLPISVIQTTQVVSGGSNSVVPVSATPVFTRGCVVKAKKSNTGVVYVGGKDVSANSFDLNASESVVLGVNDLSEVYLFFSAAGDEARVLHGQ